MRLPRFSGWPAALLPLLLLLAGCDDFVSYRVWDGETSAPPGALTLSPPAATVATGGQVAFEPSGGTPPYTFSVVSGGGEVDPSSGLFTAASEAGTSTVRVTDAREEFAESLVEVYAPLSLQPSDVTLQTGATRTFTAQGGQAPYEFRLLSGGGTIDPTGGNRVVYTAPDSATEAVIEVSDSLGNRDSSVARVEAAPPRPLAIQPSFVTLDPGETRTFSASGGTPPYTFSLGPGDDGSIEPATGVYTAPNRRTNEVVIVTDSEGASVRATVRVRD